MSEDENLVTFVRKFRWLFGNDHLTGQFNKSVQIDYKHKKISLSVYQVLENGEIPARKWLKSLKGETVGLSTFDGDGKEMYREEFTNLELEEHKIAFEYGDSDAACDEIVLSYGHYKFHKAGENPSDSE